MKNTLIAVAAVSLALSASGAVFIPQASERNILKSPLKRGEVVYVNGTAENTATCYVGTGERRPMRLVDEAALRGMYVERLDENDYAVSIGTNFTYDGQVYTTTLRTNEEAVINLPVKDALKIVSCRAIYTEKEFNGPALAVGVCVNVTYETSIDGVIARFTMPGLHEDSIYTNLYHVITVTGFELYTTKIGDGDGYNDLIQRKFLLRDTLGVIDFAELRQWAAHVHDGHYAEHWSNYMASNHVSLAGNQLRFDGPGRYRMEYDAGHTNVDIVAFGRDVMTINAVGAPDVPGNTNLVITSIDVGRDPRANGVDIVYSQGMTGFDKDDLIVEYCNDISEAGNFYSLISGRDWTFVTDNKIHIDAAFISRQKKDSGFFRLRYDAGVSSATRVEFNATVIFKRQLVIWSDDDNAYYRIKVTNGVLSAEPFTR